MFLVWRGTCIIVNAISQSHSSIHVDWRGYLQAQYEQDPTIYSS